MKRNVLGLAGVVFFICVGMGYPCWECVSEQERYLTWTDMWTRQTEKAEFNEVTNGFVFDGNTLQQFGMAGEVVKGPVTIEEQLGMAMKERYEFNSSKPGLDVTMKGGVNSTLLVDALTSACAPKIDVTGLFNTNGHFDVTKTGQLTEINGHQTNNAFVAGSAGSLNITFGQERMDYVRVTTPNMEAETFMRSFIQKK